MPRVITDKCMSCGGCASMCPMDAISEGEIHFEVNADECIDCGVCEAACPAQAIVEG